MGVGRALLIGCNYEESPRAELYGCINDVLDEFYFLTSLLAFKAKDIVLLTDARYEALSKDDALFEDTKGVGAIGAATAEHILQELRRMVAKTQPGDALFVHFSGHCSLVSTQAGTDAGVALIAGDFNPICAADMRAVLAAAPAGATVTLVLDAATRGVFLGDQPHTLTPSAACAVVDDEDQSARGTATSRYMPTTLLKDLLLDGIQAAGASPPGGKVNSKSAIADLVAQHFGSAASATLCPAQHNKAQADARLVADVVELTASASSAALALDINPSQETADPPCGLFTHALGEALIDVMVHRASKDAEGGLPHPVPPSPVRLIQACIRLLSQSLPPWLPADQRTSLSFCISGPIAALRAPFATPPPQLTPINAVASPGRTPASAAAPVRIRAVLVGCSYAGSPVRQLPGSIADVFLQKRMLMRDLGYSEAEILVLIDRPPEQPRTAPRNNDAALRFTSAELAAVYARPTGAAIKTVLAGLARTSLAGEGALHFHFSGYGVRVPDGVDAASTKCDAALCGCDGNLVMDDDIRDALAGIDPALKLTLLLDCPFASALCDASPRHVMLPDDVEENLSGSAASSTGTQSRMLSITDYMALLHSTPGPTAGSASQAPVAAVGVRNALLSRFASDAPAKVLAGCPAERRARSRLPPGALVVISAGQGQQDVAETRADGKGGEACGVFSAIFAEVVTRCCAVQSTRPASYVQVMTAVMVILVTRGIQQRPCLLCTEHAANSWFGREEPIAAAPPLSAARLALQQQPAPAHTAAANTARSGTDGSATSVHHLRSLQPEVINQFGSPVSLQPRSPPAASPVLAARPRPPVSTSEITAATQRRAPAAAARGSPDEARTHVHEGRTSQVANAILSTAGSGGGALVESTPPGSDASDGVDGGLLEGLSAPGTSVDDLLARLQTAKTKGVQLQKEMVGMYTAHRQAELRAQALSQQLAATEERADQLSGRANSMADLPKRNNNLQLELASLSMVLQQSRGAAAAAEMRSSKLEAQVSELTKSSSLMTEALEDSGHRERQLQEQVRSERHIVKETSAELQALRQKLAAATSRVSELTLNLQYGKADSQRHAQDSASKVSLAEQRAAAAEASARQLSKKVQALSESCAEVDNKLATYWVVKRERDAFEQERDLLEQKVTLLSDAKRKALADRDSIQEETRQQRQRGDAAEEALVRAKQAVREMSSSRCAACRARSKMPATGTSREAAALKSDLRSDLQYVSQILQKKPVSKGIKASPERGSLQGRLV